MTFFRPYKGTWEISQRWGKGAWGPNGEGGHPGTDYACPAGTQLVAPADWVARYVGFASGFGPDAMYLWLPGLKTAITFGHANASFIKTGQQGKAGDIIGLSGYQGSVEPPGPGGSHLHFETRYVDNLLSGNPPNVNSEQWLEFFEALDKNPLPPKKPLKSDEIKKINAIRRAVGVAQSGHWMENDDLDRRLQTLRWHYLTPPNKIDKELIVRGFQKAMDLPVASQDRIWGTGTDDAYNLCRLIFLGR